MKKKTVWYSLALLFALTAFWGFGSIGRGAVYITVWFVVWGGLALAFFTVGARTGADARFSFGAPAAAASLPDNYTAIDLVTTGSDPNVARIIEFGAVRVRDGKPVSKLAMLANPDAAIPPELAESTGLNYGTLSRQPGVAVALAQFLDFVGTDTLVAPNVDIEQTFLEINAERHGLTLPMNSTVDPLAIEHELFPQEAKDSPASERSLLERADAGDAPAPRALPNAEQTVRCYEWLSSYVAANDVKLKAAVA